MAQETAQMKVVRESAETRGRVESGQWFFLDGVPMTKVTCSASELIPSQQWGNVVVGPIQVETFVGPSGEVFFDQEKLASAITIVQKLAEAACAEERETVHALLRANVAAAASAPR